jgi:pre-mRNA-splicing helicase BRR2
MDDDFSDVEDGEGGRLDESRALHVDDDSNFEGGGDELPVASIDAYWLQRECSKYFGDPLVAQKVAADVLGTLLEPEERDCENRLVLLLDYDKFDLIKLLLSHRHKVAICTMLAQAQNESARADLVAQFEADEATRGVLAIIQAAASKTDEIYTETKQLEARVRKETVELSRMARRVEGEGVVEADLLAAVPEATCARVGKTLIDLDDLSFHQGGHLMANKKCALPPGSFRTQKKGYEEVHIPALKPKPFLDNEALIEIKAIPDWAQSAFGGMHTLNRIQSRVYECALFSADNMLLCAPTGAGKTNVAMLAILHEIGMHRNKATGSIALDAFKIVYVAPMKALVQEMVVNFRKRLAPYGINVRELTGDQQLTKQQIADTQLIITTPEKWDIITRKSGDRTYTQFVRLLIIDEIHLLHDSRGPVLESIVARTIRQIEMTQQLTRCVGLSATLPNYEDVAAFLRVSPNKGLFYFDNSYRPVPLQQQCAC